MLNAHWTDSDFRSRTMGGEEQCHLGSVLAQCMHQTCLVDGQSPSQRSSLSGLGLRLWGLEEPGKSPQGVTRKSLPAVKVLGFALKGKEEYGLTEFSDPATKELS